MSSQEPLSSFKKPVVLIVTIVLVSALIAIAVSKSMDVIIQNSGRITLVGLDAYGGDITSVNGAFSVNLGEILVGGSENVSFYLRSVSNVPITLHFSLDNWEPESLEPFMLFSWNYSGTQLAPNEEIRIRIDVSTSTSADFVNYLITNHVTSFSFSLSIYAVES